MTFDSKSFLKTLPNKPGVYQMLDAAGLVLYVGKAKNLKNRVSSYFRGAQDPKTSILLEQVAKIEIIITASENAALLLEGNLIKSLRPKYNILFKDDKSFPYLLLSEHEFPRLSVHRGPKVKTGQYFGPFPNSRAVNTTLDILQRIFKLRTCADSFFRNRSRPCMQYQIKRCLGPCVGFIKKNVYWRNIRLVEQFLCKKNNDINQEIIKLMQQAAATHQYEEAAMLRDQIAALRKVQADQCMVQDNGDLDFVAIAEGAKGYGVNVLFVRNGLVLGDKTFFPEYFGAPNAGEVLATFLVQHYLGKSYAEILPDKIITNIALKERKWIEAAFAEKIGKKTLIQDKVRGAKKELLQMAEANAVHAISSHLQRENYFQKNIIKFQEYFKLKKMPSRIECFDVSHNMGEATVASCVVFGEQGPIKKDYRYFNIKTAMANDDYAALREALLRYYKHATAPEIVLIDGGKGQLKIAREVLDFYGFGGFLLLAISKGVARKPGLEEIHLTTQSEPLIFEPTSPVLHFLQQIRDEAHRFAISGHRQQLTKKRLASVLENISGVGAKRRNELLQHFGGLREIESASAVALSEVKGISKELANKIYEYLHR